MESYFLPSPVAIDELAVHILALFSSKYGYDLWQTG